jgi:hypothetical protein
MLYPTGYVWKTTYFWKREELGSWLRLELPEPGLGCLQHFFGPDVEQRRIDPPAVRVSGDSTPNHS